MCVPVCVGGVRGCRMQRVGAEVTVGGGARVFRGRGYGCVGYISVAVPTGW